ncbi:hypothetical protein F2P56_013330 [Juglans regia]|uniref:Integrase catalytic domain-containing protein n=1 Tax=Juglans regia TaxID=51240 RepID=A0A833XPF0_JUGRE|nr:hypothetical protein F2P56_013330 [Juglans regia]
MDSAPVCVKFTGTNYSTWAFQFELFLKEKDLWGHIDGTDIAQTSNPDTSHDLKASPSWAVLDARIMSWLLGSVELHIVTNLRAHRSAQSMWNYLKKVYHQANDARRFQLEHAIAMFQHGSLSIQDYYSAFLTLWHEYTALVTADVPVAALSTIQTLHETSRRDQFLMKLGPEYESIRSSLLNRSPVPSLDICFGELLREEQRLSTQAILEQSHGSSGMATVAYAAQGRGSPMTSKNLQCFCCKEYGHIAANSTPVTHGSSSGASSDLAPPAANYCTPEMVQQMLISALSAMGFQGKNNTKLWYVDSGASNHMTNTPTTLCHVRPYAGQSAIQTANGSSLPIDAVGDASSTFTDVFLAPQLSTNLISVGQLVDNNCAVNFSGDVPSIKSFACNNVPDLSMVWHRRLSHPNTQILSHVLHSGFLAYVDNQFSATIKTLRTDSGGEYLSTEFQAFLASKGIIHQHSCLATPQQNGVAERKNRHLLDVGFICYDPTLHRTRISRNVIFFENQHFFPMSSMPSSSTVVLPSFEQQLSDLHQVSSRFKLGMVYTRRSRPQSLPVAHPIYDPHMHQNQLVAVPPEPLVRSEGSLDRYKARLVALGNNQEYGVNYEETFAPMAKMTNSKYDTSLFLRKSDMGIVVLLVYVDDIVITSSDSALLVQLKTHLSESFHMKDLGLSRIFLDLRYIVVPLEAPSVDTPMELNVKIRKEEGDLLTDPSLYRKLVGSLVYLTITRPDISFAVQQVSQFLQTPRHLHLVAVRRIIRYVQGTSARGLFFPAGNSPHLAAYSDVDWAGCVDTRRSIIGWCVFLGDALISWKSKKQDRVSKSSTESEYRAMSLACSEIIWLRGLLAELDFSEIDPTPLHANNSSVIQITANLVYHERTKHIEIDCHSIREAFEAHVITLLHISTELQIADIFTKALTRHRHCFLSSKLMLVDQPASI